MSVEGWGLAMLRGEDEGFLVRRVEVDSAGLVKVHVTLNGGAHGQIILSGHVTRAIVEQHLTQLSRPSSTDAACAAYAETPAAVGQDGRPNQEGE